MQLIIPMILALLTDLSVIRLCPHFAGNDKFRIIVINDAIRRDLASEGTELTVIWGTDPKTAMPIRAKVAAFPYYNEEYRNETFDVEKIPHPHF